MLDQALHASTDGTVSEDAIRILFTYVLYRAIHDLEEADAYIRQSAIEWFSVLEDGLPNKISYLDILDTLHLSARRIFFIANKVEDARIGKIDRIGSRLRAMG